MKKKSEVEKKCIMCGRIITNTDNKTGLCPKCQKKGNTIAAGLGLAGILAGVKKYGPKLLKSALGIIKK